MGFTPVSHHSGSFHVGLSIFLGLMKGLKIAFIPSLKHRKIKITFAQIKKFYYIHINLDLLDKKSSLLPCKTSVKPLMFQPFENRIKFLNDQLRCETSPSPHSITFQVRAGRSIFPSSGADTKFSALGRKLPGVFHF